MIVKLLAWNNRCKIITIKHIWAHTHTHTHTGPTVWASGCSVCFDFMPTASPVPYTALLHPFSVSPSCPPLPSPTPWSQPHQHFFNFALSISESVSLHLLSSLGRKTGGRADEWVFVHTCVFVCICVCVCMCVNVHMKLHLMMCHDSNVITSGFHDYGCPT